MTTVPKQVGGMDTDLPRAYAPLCSGQFGAQSRSVASTHAATTITTKPRYSVLRWDLSTEQKKQISASRESTTTNPFMRAEQPVELQDPLPWGITLACAIFDSLGGRRELGSLRRWIDPPLYRRLEARIGARAGTEPRTGIAKVRTARLHHLKPDTAELAVIVEEGGRVRAAALRLEAMRGRWRITAVEIG